MAANERPPLYPVNYIVSDNAVLYQKKKDLLGKKFS